jgi:hypothetical protein
MAEMVAPPLERPTCTGIAGGLRRLGGAGAARRLGGSLGGEWIKLCGSSVTKIGMLHIGRSDSGVGTSCLETSIVVDGPRPLRVVLAAGVAPAKLRLLVLFGRNILSGSRRGF